MPLPDITFDSSPLAAELLASARALPDDLPPVCLLLPPQDRSDAQIRPANPTGLHAALLRATLGRFSGLRPEDPCGAVDGLVWTDAAGARIAGEVTVHDLLRMGAVHFPEGPLPVPGARVAPDRLVDCETGFGPRRLHAILRLAAACGDRHGLDLLLQPETASVLVVPEDMIASTAWVLTHVARIARPVRGTRHPDAPLRLLVLRGGGGDGAALEQALAERSRLVILTPGPLPDWPARLTPPDWLGLPPVDAALIARQIAATWPGVAWGDAEAGASDPDRPRERTPPPDETLARLTATDIAAVFASPGPVQALREIDRRLRIA